MIFFISDLHDVQVINVKLDICIRRAAMMDGHLI